MVSRFLTGRRASTWCLVAILSCILTSALSALEPKDSGSYLSQKEFFVPELYISSSNEPLAAVLAELPNKAAWESFTADPRKAGRGELQVFIDPRSGTAASIVGAFPLLPGDGVGNRVSLVSLSKRLGAPVKRIDSQTVAQAALQFAQQHQGVLGIDLAQLGDVRAEKVTEDLWQVSIPQRLTGVPVRYGRVVVSISHGNVVVFGTETWGNVRGLSHRPQISPEQAQELGFAHAGGRSVIDEMVSAPTLEVLPVAQEGGPVGQGYRHRLVWTFAFQRPPDDETWETQVDAHSGEVLAFRDVNHYATAKISGGVYPLTSTGICPNADQCGTMQSGWPMPFADTGLASPNNFTNSAGLFNYTSGTATTTLAGQYVRIVGAVDCGTISNSASGSINLGGTNNQHDCTGGGGSAGNTAAARSAFYEVNKLAEMARGWLPNNTWLKAQLTANVNISNTCNAFWSPGTGTINFYRSGVQPISGANCRNTGEIAGVLDHEWGHGLDDNDTAGALSNSSEGYADIAAIYRLEASCVAHGWYVALPSAVCGSSADGTGPNCNEARTGTAVCCTDCSGIRDADYAKHSPNTPATPLGFVCSSCDAGTGPCGRQVHCAAAPVRQAAWDLVSRDLTAAPFNLDSQTAFSVGNKLFYQGSGNVGDWHSCTCGSSSNGCGSASGYMQWITADDNNGNLNDGTPHMTAIHAAFNRHGIACSTPTPQNSGCTGGPSAAPTLSATPFNDFVSLSWSSVSGATRYWVFRSEGHAGCNFGKTLIAEVTGTSYTDTQVGNGRGYYYNVVAAGTSSACYGRASNCVNVTPQLCQPGTNTLCLRSNRFKLEVSFVNGGTTSSAKATPYGDQSGFFWFLNSSNLEVGAKILGPVSGKHWLFHGGLTSLEYRLTVTDTHTGIVKTYVKPAGSFCGSSDLSTFPALVSGSPLADKALPVPFAEAGLKAVCTPNATTLCLLNDRFKVQVLRSGTPQSGLEVTSQSGAFWFGTSDNVEIVAKVLDGTPVNGHYWFFWGALSDQAYTVVVTDTVTGLSKSYVNPQGTYCGGSDTIFF